MTTPMSPIAAPRTGALFVRLALALLAVLVAVAGCGGGVGSGGTGTYAAGPITGFGSIVVGGVHFDESTASVLDDDDLAHTRSDLRLGMTVEVDSSGISSGATGRTAVASRVRFGSAIVGPVSAVDLAGASFTVLGQTVKVAVDTVFDERLAGGLAGLTVGQGLEIYALYDAANARFAATRIEPRSDLTRWALRGPVAALDTGARTLRIGDASFSYATASGVPADLAVGRIVRLHLSTVVDAGGGYVVTSFGAGLRSPDDREAGELEGLITAFTSTTSFEVGGLPVDAAAASFPDGTAGVRLGARVEVKGALRAGVLVATTVGIETEQSVDDRGFELKGSISAVDTVARTLVVRGQTISWARSDLVLEHGTLADLVVGRTIEVKARPTADRTGLEATKISFED